MVKTPAFGLAFSQLAWGIHVCSPAPKRLGEMIAYLSITITVGLTYQVLIRPCVATALIAPAGGAVNPWANPPLRCQRRINLGRSRCG
jgi:hypothetical protein